jgi:hypothetical protein
MSKDETRERGNGWTNIAGKLSTYLTCFMQRTYNKSDIKLFLFISMG